MGALLGNVSALRVKKAIKKSSSEDSLKDVIEKNETINKHLTAKDIEKLLNPANYVGSASKIVDRSVKVVRMDLQK